MYLILYIPVTQCTRFCMQLLVLVYCTFVYAWVYQICIYVVKYHTWSCCSSTWQAVERWHRSLAVSGVPPPLWSQSQVHHALHGILQTKTQKRYLGKNTRTLSGREGEGRIKYVVVFLGTINAGQFVRIQWNKILLISTIAYQK